jgi:biopolymer transport protein ExbB/TolQ
MERAVSSLTDVMFVISNALLLPVIVCVLASFAWVLVIGGGFLRELATRRRPRTALVELTSACDDPAVEAGELWKRMQSSPHPLVEFLVKGLATRPASPDALRRRLTNLESDIADSLARLSFLTRVGPMLGLLGTLIPLGPALNGLSAGNIQQLSGNLVVAFTATVIGLVVSCLAYGMGLVRRSWYGRDVDDLEHLVRRLWPGEASRAAEAQVGP